MGLPVVVVGVSHKTAPVDVRERFAAGSEILPEVLARLTARPELEEAMFLSTCNRVEVIGLPKPGTRADYDERARAASRAIREALREHIGASSADDLDDYLYEKVGDDAVRHIFRVASSLDSMVL
ncbi:MAG: glutamyl-tRNA reductase, partial [Deltaproteobacteria bacterium]|nr:glutamyl-tRNA reductase [Deltaproteobacteria bacterium]